MSAHHQCENPFSYALSDYSNFGSALPSNLGPELLHCESLTRQVFQ